MSPYLIALNEPNAWAWKQLQNTWPQQHYILTPTLAFVALEESATTGDVTSALGINAEKQILGLVANTTSGLNGYNKSAIIEWLGKNR